MVDIKDCPFCKSERVELVEKRSRGAMGKDKVSYYVRCHKCRARGPSYTGSTANASRLRFAVHDWNTAGHAPEEVSYEEDK